MKKQCPSQTNHYLFISALLVSLTICGCYSSNMKMYEGKEVTPDKRATIRCSEPQSGKIFIFEVDGKRTSLVHLQFPYEVYVLPGKHDIVIDSYYFGGEALANLWLVAEAGETYIIKSVRKGNWCSMWIENKRTRQPVGGPKDSSDEPK